MIRFRDTRNRPNPPPWLAGAPNLSRRPNAEGELWMCGDAVYLDNAGPWHDIGDGYQVAGPCDNVDDYCNPPPWISADLALDMAGHGWQAPKILNVAGDRAFRVNYGQDFMPEPTAQQYRILEVATAARDALIAATNGTQDAGIQAACRWAAEFLSVTYAIPVPAIAALGILDDVLVTNVLSISVGLPVEVAT